MNLSKNKDLREYSIYGIPILLLDKPNINWDEVVKRLKNLPQALFEGLESIVVGPFSELAQRDVQGAYMDGSIYLLPEHTEPETAFEDIVHELAHMFEEHNKDLIYFDKEVAEEFLGKRKTIKKLMRFDDINVQHIDFNNINYSVEFDNFCYQEVGYNRLEKYTEKYFLEVYGFTSLREYWATNFEAFFIKEIDLRIIKGFSPAVYNKLVSIEEDIYYGY